MIAPSHKPFGAAACLLAGAALQFAGASEVLDSSFGDAGVVLPVFAASPSPDQAGVGRTLVAQPDGKIVVAGQTGANGDDDVVLVRYEADGTLDTTFGALGVAVIRREGSDEAVTRLKLQADGKFLLAGHATTASGQDMLVMRLNANGTRDTAFGVSGVTVIDFGGEDDAAHALATDASGRVVVAGSTTGGSGDVALARCLADGSLDGSFGTGGVVTSSMGISYEESRDVAIQSDGKIVIAGFARLGNNDAFIVFRFETGGALDATFGGTGQVATQVTTSEDRAQSVVIQPNGAIVAAGWSTSGDKDFALVRYLADGTLDTAFGTGGIVSTPVGSSDDLGHTLLLQGDGKLVLGGTVYGATGQFGAVRYLATGALDNSFGTSGKKIVSIPGSEVEAAPAALQPDDKILVGGTVTNGSASDIGLIRLDDSGALDTSFNGTGTVVTDLQLLPPVSTARAVQVQADGRILMAGGVVQDGLFEFAVLRFLADGSPDPSFGVNGFASAALGSEGDFPYCMLVQSDGAILLAGQSTSGGFPQFAIARFLSNGMLDPGFGSGGVVKTAVGNSDSEIYAIALQSDGAIVAAGYAFPSATGSNIDFAIARYLADGTLDTSFGPGGAGYVTLASGSGSADDFATSVTVQDDGKIVAAGTRFPASGFSQFAMVRVSDTGALDTSFGTGGKVTTTLPGGNAQAQKVVLQSDGKLVVAGTAGVFGDADFACARYAANGVLDGTFGSGGVAIVPLGSFSDFANDLVLDGSGRFLLAGTTFSGSSRFAVARLTAAGVLDTSFDDDGQVTFDLTGSSETAYALAVQSDGKILLAGDSGARMALLRTVDTAANQPPMAVNDSAFVLPGATVSIPVLANDTDPDEDTLMIGGFSQPLSGGMVAQFGDALHFTAASDFTGASFGYTASDGNGGTAPATVTVTPVTTFAQWQVAWFGVDATDPEIAGSLKDPDHDGLFNLLEYALGRNPLIAETVPACTMRIEAGRLVLTCSFWAAASDLSIAAEFAGDVSGWSANGVTQQETANDGILQTLEFTGPLQGGGRQFGHILVTR